jgi:DNA-binding transcriptional LysR family regulator
LRVNHATVARRIASLETLIGRALFDRRAEGYVLTAEGKAVLEEASAMDEAAMSILRRRDARTELNGLVRLAAGRVLAERDSSSIVCARSTSASRRSTSK